MTATATAVLRLSVRQARAEGQSGKVDKPADRAHCKLSLRGEKGSDKGDHGRNRSSICGQSANKQLASISDHFSGAEQTVCAYKLQAKSKGGPHWLRGQAGPQNDHLDWQTWS